MNPQSVKRWLLGILLLALAVRAVNLDGQSYFVDEVAEVELAKKSTDEILKAPDSSPPLYPLVLKSWVTVWGTDASARWFSVICGVASVALVWAIGRRLVDDKTGLAAAFVCALLPMHVYYSQFVRAYSLIFLLVAASLWLLLRAVASDRPRDWAAFVVVALLGAYTHYYFAIFLATSFIVVCLLRRHWWVGGKALAAYATIGLLSLPLIWFFKTDLQYQQSLREPRPVGVATIGYTYFSFFNGYTFGPSTSELQTMGGAAAIRAAAPWLAAVGIVLLVLGLQGAIKLYRDRQLPAALALLILPVAMLAGISITMGLNYNVRFVTWAMIPAALLLGAGIVANSRNWATRLAVVGFVVLSAIAMINRHTVPRYQHEDLRSAAGYLQANATASDTIYVLADYLTIPLRYYIGSDWKLEELPEPGRMGRIVREKDEAADIAAATVFQQPPGRTCWLVYSRSFHGDPDGYILEALTAHQPPPELATTFAGVTIYKLQRPPDERSASLR